MAFPTSPTAGQQHTAYGDTYTWDGNNWTAGGVGFTADGRPILIDEVTPTETAANAVWYRLDTSSVSRRTATAWEHINDSVSIGGPQAPATPVTPPASAAAFTISMADQLNEQNSMSTWINFVPAAGTPDGTYNWTITGVDASDIDIPLTGSINVSGGSVTNNNLFMTAVEDATTEGDETLTITIDETGDSASLTIWDTSTAPAAPSVTCAVDAVGIREGSRGRTVTITPTAAAVGTTVNWLLYSDQTVDPSELDPARSTNGTATSGSITFADTTPIVYSFVFISDGVVEGTENIVFAMDNGESCTWYVLDS